MVKALGTVQIAHDRRTCFGASPFWDSDQSALIYVDVNKRAIYRYKPDECLIEKYKEKEAALLAFAIPVEGCPNDFVVATDRNLQLVRWTDDKTTESFFQHGREEVQGKQSPLRRISTGQDKPVGRPVPSKYGRPWKPQSTHVQCCQCGRMFPRPPSRVLPPSPPTSTTKIDSDQQSTSTYGWDCVRSINQSERHKGGQDGLQGEVRADRGGGCTGGGTEDGEEAEGDRSAGRRDDPREAVPVSSRTRTRRRTKRAAAGYGHCDERERSNSNAVKSREKSPNYEEDGEGEGEVDEAREEKFKPETIILATLNEPEGNFYKTGKIDTCGRLWVGTSGRQNGDQVGCVEAPERGNVYGLTWQRELQVKIPSVSQASGFAWSPDNRTFYLLDATESCVFAYDYHDRSGCVACPRAIFDTSVLGKRAVPHGMTIDNDGYLYIAIYGLGKVIIVDPETRKMAGYVCIPTPYVTGVTWGGEMLDTLYVTTAAKQANIHEHPKSGSLFQVTNLMAKGFKNLKANVIPP